MKQLDSAIVIIAMRLIKSRCYAVVILIIDNLVFFFFFDTLHLRNSPRVTPEMFAISSLFRRFAFSTFCMENYNTRRFVLLQYKLCKVASLSPFERKSIRNSRRSRNNEINNEIVSTDRERAIRLSICVSSDTQR